MLRKLPLLALPLLAACGGSGTGKVASASVAPPVRVATAVRPPVRRTGLAPTVQVLPGLEGVIGATEPELERAFGKARLEVWEGDARKLQFTGTPCVLDVFLYPGAAGQEPQATYVDARRPSDGQEVDRAACVAALRTR